SLKRTDEAQAEAAKLIATDVQEGIFILNLAETFAESGYVPYAINIIEKAIAENASEKVQLQLLLANLYSQIGNTEKANALWVELFNQPEVPFENKAYLLANLTDEISYNPQSAESENKKKLFTQLFTLVEKEYPQEAKVFVLQADFCMIIGETTQAANAYEKALQLGDETAEVFQNVLLLHAQKNNYQQLINIADKALELYPNQGIFYYYSGFGHLMKKSYTQSIAALEQAKKLSAQNPTFLQDIGSLLGDAYQYNRDFAKSEKAYEEVLALNPDNETVLNNYAYYLSLRKANLEKAEVMAKHLTDLSPNNPTYLDTYAWVLYTKQQYREAKKIMEKVIASGKANATHLEHYGDILFKLGQTTEAVSYWEKAKAINTTSETLSKKIANKTLYDQ
ncbi:MAG: tetratricopeptide repeat protein, partial [Cyclobacteriaceae bacterium]|nr:tetratricopeptide repeat protein [Cyclobacteriaceae bacterium]